MQGLFLHFRVKTQNSNNWTYEVLHAHRRYRPKRSIVFSYYCDCECD